MVFLNLSPHWGPSPKSLNPSYIGRPIQGRFHWSISQVPSSCYSPVCRDAASWLGCSWGGLASAVRHPRDGTLYEWTPMSLSRLFVIARCLSNGFSLANHGEQVFQWPSIINLGQLATKEDKTHHHHNLIGLIYSHWHHQHHFQQQAAGFGWKTLLETYFTLTVHKLSNTIEQTDK